MARFERIKDINDLFRLKNTKIQKIYCSICESANIKIIGNNIVECQVCKACKSV